MIAPNGFYGRQVRRVRELSASFPALRISDDPPIHPDEWFRDGAHLREEKLPQVAEEYGRILASFGFP
jgi:hypothetical protein